MSFHKWRIKLNEKLGTLYFEKGNFGLNLREYSLLLNLHLLIPLLSFASFATLKLWIQMLKPKLQRFASATTFACPICQENLTLVENVASSVAIAILLTWRNSAMSILAPPIKQSANYDKENFSKPSTNPGSLVLSGYSRGCSDLLTNSKTRKTILDIGCSEGFYSRKLQERHPDKPLRLWYFKDSRSNRCQERIQLGSQLVRWGLSSSPYKRRQHGYPTWYLFPAKLRRISCVLSKDGILIKVIPTKTTSKKSARRYKTSWQTRTIPTKISKSFFKNTLASI